MSRIKTLIAAVKPEGAKLARQMTRLITNLKKNYEYVFKVQTIENYLNPELGRMEMQTWDLETRILKRVKENMFKTDPNIETMVKEYVQWLPKYFIQSINLIDSVVDMFNEHIKRMLGESLNVYDGLDVPRGIINSKRGDIVPAIDKFSAKGAEIMKAMKDFQLLARQLDSVKPIDSPIDFVALYKKLDKSAHDIKANFKKFSLRSRELLEAMKTVSETLIEESYTLNEHQDQVRLFLKKVSANIRQYNWTMSKFQISSAETYFSDMERKAYDLIPIWKKVTKESLVKLVSPSFKERIGSYVRGSNKLIDILHTIESTKSEIESIKGLKDAVKKIKKDIPALIAQADPIINAFLPKLDVLESDILQLYRLIKGVQKESDGFAAWLEHFRYQMKAFNKTLRIDDVMIR
jgi:uncharacterized coiled-coil DUF342 family protein